MGTVIPVLFLILFTIATGAFLLYRRKSIVATIPFVRTLLPLIMFFLVSFDLLLDPQNRFGQGIIRYTLMFLLALSILGLSLSMHRVPDRNGESAR